MGRNRSTLAELARQARNALSRYKSAPAPLTVLQRRPRATTVLPGAYLPAGDRVQASCS